MERARSAIQQARESLFFIPALGIVSFSGLAIFVLFLDRTDSISGGNSALLLSSTVAGGRSIATTVAGATITVAAIVFSITALSSQIAANQYSPRAVRGFFEDTFQQVVIGLIVGTFTYSLLILGGLSTSLVGASEPTPSIAVTINVFLGVASAIGIVAYIDHSLQRFQVDAVVRRISNGTLGAIRRQKRGDHPTAHRESPSGEAIGVVARRSGWVQHIDGPRIARTIPPGSSVNIVVRTGEPVSKGDRLASLWTDGDEERTSDLVRKSVAVEKSRSLDDDPSFGIRQLTDIALKALSPGINDPTTALDVVHHLKSPIKEILTLDAPARVFGGPDSQRVYLTEAPSRSDYVHAAFAEIRLNSRSQPTVLNALLEVLGDLRGEFTKENLGGRLGAINEEWNLTIDTLVSSGLPEQDIGRVLRDRTKVEGS